MNNNVKKTKLLLNSGEYDNEPSLSSASSSASSSSKVNNNNNDDEKQKMILPIFPLRKKVKFPTEALQLTLWEERYKRLAQNVLNQEGVETNTNEQYHSFGIVYASHKPQIIRNGVLGPITPILNDGDIGVLCVVKEYSLFKDNVEIVNKKDFPSLGDNGNDCVVVEDVDEWNKLRLIGLGISRFRVEKVLSRGFGGGDSSFLIVEASKIDDHIPEDESVEYKEILHWKKKIQEQDWTSCKYEDIEKDYQLYQKLNGKKNDKNQDEELRILQLWSFAMMSEMESDSTADEMLNILSSRSIKERLEYIHTSKS